MSLNLDPKRSENGLLTPDNCVVALIEKCDIKKRRRSDETCGAADDHM
jgi:hypothetical protein